MRHASFLQPRCGVGRLQIDVRHTMCQEDAIDMTEVCHCHAMNSCNEVRRLFRRRVVRPPQVPRR